MASEFDAVVFAGGGCRCFWQLGFWKVVAPELALAPQVVGAVSAGAAMACLIFGGRAEAGLASFKRRTAANPRNAYPENLLRRAPVFPHERIYRDTILESLDAAALERLRRGPDIHVLLARPPQWLGPRLSILAAFGVYQVENLLRPSVHPWLGRRAGFVTEAVSLRSCRTPEEVTDLILHSSCTPPLTRAYRRDRRPVLDGALVDNAPVGVVGRRHARTLVLLTERYPEELLPQVDGRTYVQPSTPIPIHKWDYTSPAGVQATYDLGRRDGERFLRGA
jgi:predicted acylesterase/phospholipase RssA